MAGQAIDSQPAALPEEGPGSGRWRQRGVTALFLGPAFVFLAVWIVYSDDPHDHQELLRCGWFELRLV